MASNITPSDAVLFTAEDVVSFCRIAVGWVQRSLCDAVLRTQANGADILVVMSDGSRTPLWGVEKHPDDTYWLFTRSRQPLASGKTMEEVLGYLNLSGEQVNPPLP
jgi:hypothetical protein